MDVSVTKLLALVHIEQKKINGIEPAHADWHSLGDTATWTMYSKASVKDIQQ